VPSNTTDMATLQYKHEGNINLLHTKTIFVTQNMLPINSSQIHHPTKTKSKKIQISIIVDNYIFHQFKDSNWIKIGQNKWKIRTKLDPFSIGLN
jgi:hypothetical protein